VVVDKKVPVIYTRYNLGASLDGQKCDDSVAVKGESAYKLAATIILFTMAF